MTRRWTKAVAAVGVLAALTVVGVMVGFELLIRATPLPDLSRRQYLSHNITSSSGEILWAFLTPDQKWRLPASETDVDPQYQRGFGMRLKPALTSTLATLSTGVVAIKRPSPP
jgi:membrane carboxypeptidase/penicillin-binding protein PbpC